MGVQAYSRGERRLHSNYPSKRSEHREPAATVHPFMGDFLIAGHGESSAFRVVNTRSTICPLLTVQLCRTALGPTHDKNLSRETHPPVCGILTKSFEHLALRFIRLLLGKHGDLFPKLLRPLVSQCPKVFH